MATELRTPNPNARPVLCSSTVCRRPMALGQFLYRTAGAGAQLQLIQLS